MKAENIFQIVAVVLAGTAVYFWWTGYSDGVFAALVLAASAFFLSLRFQMRSRTDLRDAENSKASDEPDIE
ncbi:MAG TPA: hypothetical protein VK468_00180 [Pyrinomonadaceae bacterium]|nr:hypothetical protein [Pyrinomonadaceae bacterium]